MGTKTKAVPAAGQTPAETASHGERERNSYGERNCYQQQLSKWVQRAFPNNVISSDCVLHRRDAWSGSEARSSAVQDRCIQWQAAVASRGDASC
jgi:hypothetical protein